MPKRKPVSVKASERRGIHATRDERADAGYIYLAGKIKKGEVARSRGAWGSDNDSVILDFAEDGRLIGIKLLSLKLMPWKKRRRVSVKEIRK